jgi:two-component system NtrC family sensor kinase
MIRQSFRGLLAWMIVTAVVLVTLSIVSVNLVSKLIIDAAAARDRHEAFLRATATMNRIVQQSGDVRHVRAIERMAQDILELRPGLRRLSFFDLTKPEAPIIWSSDPEQAPKFLTPHEVSELSAGRSASYFDATTDDHAWIIVAPIMMGGQITGALRGRFSVAKFDRIAEQEQARAGLVAIGMVGVTCLAFFALVQRQVRRPIHRILEAMRRAEAGDLTSRASLVGPIDLQAIAIQFNQMLDRIRVAVDEKERLLGEIRDLNDTLTARIAEAKEELQQTHAILVEARIKAERNEKLAALGELSAVMAHELGNPLNAISGHLQLLAQTNEKREFQRHLAILKSETDRMVRTIHTLLESTRLRAQMIPLELNVIIQDIVTVMMSTLEDRKITIKASLSPRLPEVLGDPQALHGLVFNLITNAVHAMPRGGELEITTARVKSDDVDGILVVQGSPQLEAGAVRLSVRDTGVGIPPDVLLRIFDPFYTTRQSAGGTGLGLTICQRTVSAHGGRLAVRSAVGQGTQFTVDLALA